MCIVYNTEQVTEAEAPKHWPDLLEPNWKGKVAIGHPGFSGYVGIWTVKMRELSGWAFFAKMAAPDPRLGRSPIAAVTNTPSGEPIAGLWPSASSPLATST